MTASDFKDYVYHTCAGSGSGEYALGSILAPGAWARKPLDQRLHHLKMETIFLYGDTDWMDYRNALKAVKKMNVPRKVIVVGNAGHHIYLDNPTGFNDTLIAEMNSSKKFNNDQIRIMYDSQLPLNGNII